MKLLLLSTSVTIICLISISAAPSEGSIECQLFGDVGCTAHCKLRSDLFGSSINPSCGQDNSCNCNETYDLNGPATAADVDKLTLGNVLSFKFEDSSIPWDKINRIKDQRASEDIIKLDQPGSLARDQLFKYPVHRSTNNRHFMFIAETLVPRRQIKINTFFKDLPKPNQLGDSYEFYGNEFQDYVASQSRKIAQELAPSINEQIYATGVEELLRDVVNINDLRKITKNIQHTLYDNYENYLTTGHHRLTSLTLGILEDEPRYQYTFDSLPLKGQIRDVEDIENIILANIVMELNRVQQQKPSTSAPLESTENFQVKIFKNRYFNEVQAWKSENTSGYIRHNNLDAYGKLWKYGNEQLYVKEQPKTSPIVYWNAPRTARIYKLFTNHHGTEINFWNDQKRSVKFNKSSDGTVQKTWRNPTHIYYVSELKDGPVLTICEAPQVKIFIKEKPRNYVQQIWQFPKFTIKVNKFPYIQVESCPFYELTSYPSGEKIEKGNRNLKVAQHYRRYMQTWCQSMANVYASRYCYP